MKKLYTLFTGLAFLGLSCFAQVALTYEIHGLAADNLNQMKITEWMEPGQGGENQLWDYSGLKTVKDFEGSIIHSYEAPNGNLFPESNVELKEFGNSFFFNLKENILEQNGLVSSSGKLVITYDRPFVKMKYPFTYGGYFSGNYGGTYKFASVDANIDGTYSVEADGYGSLKLPGNIYAENTLRVKTIREYDRIYGDHTTHMKVTTFRWYAGNIKFPLLVLTKMESTTNGKTHTSYQAAYRDNLATDVISPSIAGIKLNVYPNPAKSIFNINYEVQSEGDVLIQIFDNTGKLVKNIVDEVQVANFYNIELNTEDLGLSNGHYLIKSTLAGQSTTTGFVKE